MFETGHAQDEVEFHGGPLDGFRPATSGPVRAWIVYQEADGEFSALPVGGDAGALAALLELLAERPSPLGAYRRPRGRWEWSRASNHQAAA